MTVPKMIGTFRKQKEKEEKFSRLRKQHEKELKLLATQSQKKVNNIFKIMGSKESEAEEILKYQFASAPTKVGLSVFPSSINL